jgi:hypothetical protein
MSPSDSPADWSGSTSSSSSSSSSASAPWSGSPSEREADKFKASPNANEGRDGSGRRRAHRSIRTAGCSAAHFDGRVLRGDLRIFWRRGDDVCAPLRRRAPVGAASALPNPGAAVGSFALRVRFGFSGTNTPELKSESLSESARGTSSETSRSSVCALAHRRGPRSHGSGSCLHTVYQPERGAAGA